MLQERIFTNPNSQHHTGTIQAIEVDLRLVVGGIFTNITGF